MQSKKKKSEIDGRKCKKMLSVGVFLMMMVGVAKAQNAAEPVASVSRGYYSAPFQVALTSTTVGAQIYYTTDGSTPTADGGTMYTEPITISKTTPLRAVATGPGLLDSKVLTHTYIFLDDVITQGNTPPGYPDTFAADDGNGPYPADYEMDPEIVNHPKYQGKVDDALAALPAVSIVTDIPNLFDPATGIYYNPNEKSTDLVSWERAINVEFIDSTGCGIEASAHAGLRIHGQASRRPKRMPKKNFRMYFKAEYGTKDLDLNLFKYNGEAFPPVASFDRLILKNGGNRSWPYWDKDQRREVDYANDAWSRLAHLDMGALTSHNTYAHLYINGLYWGLYMVAERLDEKFYASYLGGNPDFDFDLIDADEDLNDIPVANAGTMDVYNAMIAAVTTPALAAADAEQDLLLADLDARALDPNFTSEQFLAEWKAIEAVRRNAVNQDPITDEQLAELAQMVDFENLADYMILNHYIGKTDWAHHNWNAYRKRVGPDTRFKFSAWDNDSGVGKVTEDTTWKDDADSPTRVYFRLLTNPEFRQMVGDRIQKHLFNGGALSPEKGVERYLKLTDTISQAVIAESARWGDYSRDVYQRVDAPPGKTLPAYIHTRDLTNLEADPNNEVDDRVQKNWIQVRAEHLNTYFPNRGGIMISQYITEGWYDPSVIAPMLSQYGGNVVYGQSLGIANINVDAAGDIYYTLDGSDPRLAGGAINPNAVHGGDSVSLTVNHAIRLKARVYDETTNVWSYLQDYTYIVPTLVPDLVINEINYKDGPLISGDWFEIYNPTDEVVNLSGWVITDNGPLNPFTVPNGTTIPAKGYLVVAANPAALSATYPWVSNVVGPLRFGLGSTDSVVLKDPWGYQVDRVDYQDAAPWPSAPNGSGPTLCLRRPELDNATAEAWAESAELGGTPGEGNVKDGVSLPPTVAITGPLGELVEGSAVAISASASDTDGSIASVDFYVNGFLFGSATAEPFSVAWSPTEGIYNLLARVTDNSGEQAWSIPYEVIVNPASSGGAGSFLEIGGQVVIEGEHFATNIPGPTHTWEPTIAQPGFLGEGAMVANPNVGVVILGPGDKSYEGDGSEVTSGSPMMGYNVYFSSPGTYYFFLRGYAATGDENSIHIGIDGQPSHSLVLSTVGAWTWRGNQTISVSSPGLHQVNIWMREDGCIVDRFVLTTNQAYDPLSEDPAESSHEEVFDLNAPPSAHICEPIDGARYLLGDTLTIGVDSVDRDGVTTQVAFFANGQQIGLDTSAPYGVTWTPPGGAFEITVVATDDDGASTRSMPVTISVLSPIPSPSIVISEINYADGASVVAGDWVELYNPNAEDVDLSGWILRDNSPLSRFIIPFGTILAPGENLVVVANSALFSSAHPSVSNFVGNMNFGLGSAGDSVVLLDSFEREVDRVDYLSTPPWPLQANGTGPSLCLIDTALDNNLATSWTASPNTGGTPGSGNAKGVINTPPVVTLTSPVSGASFPSGAIVPLAADASDSDGSVVSVEFFAIPSNGLAQSLGKVTAAPFSLDWAAPDGLFSIKAVAVDDLGAITTSLGVMVNVSDAPPSPLLVINEINYSSPANGLVTPPFVDSGDWVEIYNPGITIADVSGWTMRDGDPLNAPYSFPSGTTIAAGGYLVVVRDPISFAQVHPDVDFVATPFAFGLGSIPGDSVLIFDPIGNKIDEVDFLSTAPWPPEANGTGPVLCLINPTFDNNDPASWASSTQIGGTPGKPNTKGSNQAPEVSISTPANGASLIVGELNEVAVIATDDTGIAKVELFVDRIPADATPPVLLGTKTLAPFGFSWTASAPGEFQLIAVATDSEGIATMSNPVNVLVGFGAGGGYSDFASTSIQPGKPSGFAEDGDGDGEPNGAEYGLGTDVNGTDGDQAKTPKLEAQGDNVVISFHLNLDARHIAWVLYRSDRVGGWKEIYRRTWEGVETGDVISVLDEVTGVLTLTDTNPPNPRGFYQLHFENLEPTN